VTGTRLVLVRHGQHDLAIEDGPLTSIGVRQAELLARSLRIERTDVVRSSPQLRARQTVARLGAGFVADVSLRGIDFGEAFTGESIAAFLARVAATMARLTAKPAGGRVIVCTHSDVIDATLRWARGLAPDQKWTIQGVVPNASMTELDVRPGRPTLVCRVGDVRYLPPELVTDI
jgi:broad specificity phosphatase PhoE